MAGQLGACRLGGRVHQPHKFFFVEGHKIRACWCVRYSVKLLLSAVPRGLLWAVHAARWGGSCDGVVGVGASLWGPCEK